MVVRRVISYVTLAVFTSLFFFGCKSPEEPNGQKPDNGFLQLKAPLGGETFKVGDKVTVKFIVTPAEVLQTDISVSIDNGATFKEVTSASIPSKGAIEQSYEWTIGQEKETVDYKATNTTCILKIRDYRDATHNDKSKAFTINKP
ncbi:MAG: hypothetical protein JW795_16575 [Chitinivibrionales bacterium]|nr:hypothetical protein [Chitinivibrionales bacterium]